MVEIIKTENLVKKFGKTIAVDDISISVKKGEIYGFLGLNGAGKTTLIRCLLGLVKPSSGKVFLHSKEVKPGLIEIWKDVGYMVETPYAYPDLTVSENLEIIRKLRRCSDPFVVTKVIEKLNLLSYKDVLAKNLSLGNSQRLGIAKAILHDPSILILDEPSNGLDPAGIVEIRELLMGLAKNGVTIFISSHILDEIAKIANRIGIIDEGKLILEITSHELKVKLNKHLFVSTRNNVKLESILRHEGYEFESKNGVISISDSKAIEFPEAMATLLVSHEIPPILLKVESEDLESYFLRTISTKEVFS